MKSNSMLSLIGLSASAVLTTACGGIGNPGGEQETGQTSAALESAAADKTPTLAAEKAKSQSMRAAGSTYSAQTLTGVPMGNTYIEALTISAGSSVSFWTSNPDPSSADSVCALFQRTDNSSTFVAWPWTTKVGINTLAADDDGAGHHMSSVSYTAPTNGWPTINAWLMCFAFCYDTAGVADCRTGYVDINGTFSRTHVPLQSGGVPDPPTEGMAYVTDPSSTSLDPVLFVFDQITVRSNGGWIDDAPSGCPNTGTLLPCFQGLTNQAVWMVSDTIGRYTTGTATLHW